MIHSLPSRIRIHIPDWGSFEKSVLEHRLRLVPGVCAVRANPLTRNVLIQFEPPPGGKARVLKLIDAVLRKCAAQADHPDFSAAVMTTLSATVSTVSQRVTRPSPQPRAVSTGSLLAHAPAIAGLILSLLSCSSPLGMVRVGIEGLQLLAQLSAPAPASA